MRSRRTHNCEVFGAIKNGTSPPQLGRAEKPLQRPSGKPRVTNQERTHLFNGIPSRLLEVPYIISLYIIFVRWGKKKLRIPLDGTGPWGLDKCELFIRPRSIGLPRYRFTVGCSRGREVNLITAHSRGRHAVLSTGFWSGISVNPRAPLLSNSCVCFYQ